MSVHGVTGESSDCPHCGERILRSALTCPACRRRLHADAVTAVRPAGGIVCPFTLDGTIRHPGRDAAWEYSVLIEVHDEAGNLLARRVVGVGALTPGETRRITLRVEVQLPVKPAPSAAS